MRAAGIAYRVLFSIAPLAIVLVSIFGLVLQDDSVRHDVVDAIVDALPVSVAGRKDVEDAITEIATPASAAGLIGVLVFVWAATGMMTAIRRGLESAMERRRVTAAGAREARRPRADRGRCAARARHGGTDLLGNFVQRASGSLGEAHRPRLRTLASAPLAWGQVRPLGCRRAAALPVRPARAGSAPATGSRELSSPPSSSVDLARLRLDQRKDRKAQRGLRLAHGGARLPLLRLSLLFALLLGAEIAAAWSRPQTGPADRSSPR